MAWPLRRKEDRIALRVEPGGITHDVAGDLDLEGVVDEPAYKRHGEGGNGRIPSRADRRAVGEKALQLAARPGAGHDQHRLPTDARIAGLARPDANETQRRGIDVAGRRRKRELWQAEAAFKSILSWIGENPERDGLHKTPGRLVRAYREYFCGYDEEPEEILRKTFEEIDGYDEMVVLRGVAFESHCEHHVAPIIGRVWVGYVPDRRVVGISMLARVVEAYARPLQIQERMTAQIANAIERVLKPRGVAVVIKATHHCMLSRGVRKHGADLVTSRMLGCFRDDAMTRSEFLAMTNSDV